MPPRARAQEDTATEDSGDSSLPTSGSHKFVVLTNGVTIEYRPEKDGKKARIGRATRGQVITLDMGVINTEKIQRLVELKALAPYEEGGQYQATTARVAADAAGARRDPVTAPVIDEHLAAPQEADPEEDDENEGDEAHDE